MDESGTEDSTAGNTNRSSVVGIGQQRQRRRQPQQLLPDSTPFSRVDQATRATTSGNGRGGSINSNQATIVRHMVFSLAHMSIRGWPGEGGKSGEVKKGNL